MAELIVEIHVPFAPNAAGEYEYTWIDDIEEYLAELDGTDGEEYDSGEELGGEYLFFVSGAPESTLIELARRIARLPGVPLGV